MRLAACMLLVLMFAAPARAARPIIFAETPQSQGTIIIPLAAEADLAVRVAGLGADAAAAVRRALATAGFGYKANATLSLRGVPGHDEIIIIGTGGKLLDGAALQKLGGAAAQAAKTSGMASLLAGDLGVGADSARQLAVGAALGSYSFARHKGNAKPAGKAPFVIVTPGASAARAAFGRDGQALVDGVSLARDLIWEPANVIYPESFVDRVRDALKETPGVRIEVLDAAAMARLGMGGILSVGQGSARPPRLLVVEYRGSGAPALPVALVGKGITFDSGGVSIKPASGMWRMKYDMSGAAAVVGTAVSLARSRAPVNIVAIAALAENMPGGSAARPGDVLKTYSGKTIEVISTDAEGRVVLSDAVAYAERRFRPSAIIDIATLTGSITGALGNEYAGLFTRDDALAAALIAAGAANDEDVWRMPLHPSYADDIRSDIADVRNSTEGLNPGAGHGAQFIGSFVSPATRWAHLDIAGRAWSTEDLPAVPKGAVGYGVRLLDSFVRAFARQAGSGDN